MPFCIFAFQRNATMSKDSQKRLVFVDVSRVDFDAKKFGFEDQPLRRYLYAKDASGQSVRGVDALIWIWQACGENADVWIVSPPGIKQVGKVFYRLIQRFRYRLVGKHENVCDSRCAKEI